jgi:hypothetical protein
MRDSSTMREIVSLAVPLGLLEVAEQIRIGHLLVAASPLLEMADEKYKAHGKGQNEEEAQHHEDAEHEPPQGRMAWIRRCTSC